MSGILRYHRYVLVSLLVLIPCLWPPIPQTLDLPSHLYNAWLASLVEQNAAPGLSVVPIWTNVLFDWILSGLLRFLSSGAAERAAAGIAALTCFWSVFTFFRTVTGRVAWISIPALMVITWGAMFRYGFFNFYLSTALSVAALSLLCRPSKRRVLIPAVLLCVAATGHTIPVGWALFCAAYLFLLRRSSRPGLLLATTILSILVILATVIFSIPTFWKPGHFSPFALLSATIAGQLFTYDDSFLLYMYLWLVTATVAVVISRYRGDPYALDRGLVHLTIITGLTFLLTPNAIELPHSTAPLGFLQERFAFFCAILTAACLHTVTRKWIAGAFAGISAAFLAAIFLSDAQTLRLDRDISTLVRSVPAGSVFVAAWKPPEDSHINMRDHALDRACLGHCFNYGNYEAPSRWFRLRAEPGNHLVLSSTIDVRRLETGQFRPRPEDLPLNALIHCEQDPGQLCVKRLSAGEEIGRIDVKRLKVMEATAK